MQEENNARSRSTVSKNEVSSDRRVRNDENENLERISRIIDNGLVESHIIWDAPALVTASYSGATCDICVYWETATFNI